MSKNKLNSKIDNLFNAIVSDSQESVPVKSIDTVQITASQNWDWETDLNGIFIESSDAVNEILGFSVSEVIGQPFVSFGLDSTERNRLMTVLAEGIFPAEIELRYLRKDNHPQQIRVNIIQAIDDSEKITGFRGFSQIVSGVTTDNTVSEGESPLPKKRINTGPLPLTGEISTSSATKQSKVSKPREIAPKEPVFQKVNQNIHKLAQTASLNTVKPTQTAPLTSSLRTPDLLGLSLSNNQFNSTDNIWTQQGIISFSEDQFIATPSENDAPAIISAPLKLRQQKSGVIEIIDTKSNRKWTEEDRLLVQEVTNQLGLALENAQLYSAVQKELIDRVKAEEETVRRNKELSKLNEVMQQLTRLVSQEEIFNIVGSTVQDLLRSDNILISYVPRDSNKLTFPFCIVDGEKAIIKGRPLEHGYQEAVLQSQKPMIIQQDTNSSVTEKEVDHPNNIPLSLLAVPMIAGDRSLGVISVFDYKNDNAFTSAQSELLSTVAAQTATALENTNLFREIRQALETIEGRARYQSNVTDAVALLSEKGSSSIDLMLESLAKAAKCEKVFYAKCSEVESEQTIWNVSDQYSVSEDFKAKGIQIKEIIAPVFSQKWIEVLNLKGWVSLSLTEGDDQEKTFLASKNIKSLLLLPIKTGEGSPDLIGLENLENAQTWNSEDIDVLRIATDALRNTLIREGLLNQVQESLGETENLYSASHKLALADDMNEMVEAILTGVHIPEINRGVLVLFEYDQMNQLVRMSVEANYYSGVGTPPPPIGTEYLKSLYSGVFTVKNPVFYDDVLESQINRPLQDILIRQNIRSLAVLPLWAGLKQIGVLLIQADQRHQFTSQETRSYPPLVDQLSTTIENLHLYKQTQSALAETGLLYRISSGISRSSNLEEFVKLIGENAMPPNVDTVWLLSAGQQNRKTNDFDVVGSYNVQNQFKRAGNRLSADLFSFINFGMAKPVLVSDITKSELSSQAQTIFKNMNISTAGFIPLQTTGNPVGVIVAGSQNPSDLTVEELQTLQVVGNSIAVAIERQRLLFEAQRRALELQSAAEIARDTTSTLSFDILLNRIVNLIKDRFGYYHCSIFLLDESNTYAVIQEATGDAGVELKRRKHKMAIGSQSVVGTCAQSGEPVIVNDVTRSPIYYPNPLLPETRSELSLPMKITGRVIGVVDLHSSDVNAFTPNELTVLQILTDQVSVAIENARAYEISQQAVEEMRELDRVKSQFLANMSHELRTPLNSVIGFSRVILKGIDGPINDVQEQDITAIYNSGMHLLNMINEVLDLSKIEAGKMELQIDDVNVSDIINSAITTATGLVKDKPIELIQKVPANLPIIRADEIRISQVLINLISNAVKFTEKGSITIEATLRNNTQNQPEIFFTVTDTGIGVAEEDQSKLFQRFSQVDDSPTRKTGGTGLGLSICRSLIELHGGKIGLLSSEVGKGSIFYFTLPAPEVNVGLDIEQLTHGEKVILSIDDDEQVIALYARFLKTHGYEVIALTDPTKAVERAKELNPFAITLDIMMPQKDGWQVLRELKADNETRDIPILICSILEEEEKGYNLGASEYLVKPFLQDDLTNAISRLNKDDSVHEVLIVDDDPDDLRLAQKMVEQEGKLHATLADGGLAALETLKTLTPDLIILDLFMPDYNGFELLESFKSESRLNRIPVIILTGADLNPDQQQLISEFGNQILTKASLKENDLLLNIQDTLSRIKPTRLVN